MFLFKTQAEEAQFDFGRTSEPEFDQYRWVNYWSRREVIYFKRAVREGADGTGDVRFPGWSAPYPEWWRNSERPRSTQHGPKLPRSANVPQLRRRPNLVIARILLRGVCSSSERSPLSPR